MDTIDGIKNSVLESAERHPYILLGAVIILLIILLVSHLHQYHGWSFGCLPSSKRRKRSKNLLDNDSEMDELIEQIHAKQKAPIED